MSISLLKIVESETFKVIQLTEITILKVNCNSDIRIFYIKTIKIMLKINIIVSNKFKGT